MKYCKKCDVSINSPVSRCPLCYATLIGKDNMPEPVAYPELAQAAARYNMLFRILLFLSLTASVVCVTINLVTTPARLWSAVVIANIVYMWIAIGTAMRKHAKLGHTIMIQGISLAGLIMVMNLFFDTRVNWAFNYALPFLFFSVTLSITIIVIVKRMAIRDFILYFILTALMGLLPLLALAMGLVTVIWPSLVSAIYSGLALVSIFIFADNATKIELKKRFHI